MSAAHRVFSRLGSKTPKAEPAELYPIVAKTLLVKLLAYMG